MSARSTSRRVSPTSTAIRSSSTRSPRTCAAAGISTRRCRASCGCAKRSPRSTSTRCGRRYDPETEVTVTSGGTEGIFDAVAASVGPGDEVIVFEPCYDSYVPAIELSGGTPVFVPLQFPDYSIDWDAVRRAITARTRMIMLNSPHNPAGSGAHARRHSSVPSWSTERDIVDRQRRGLRAHHLRRAAAREHGAPRCPRRRAASSSVRSARRITPPAGRWATRSRRRR